MSIIEDEYSNGFDSFLDEEDLGNADYYCEHGTFIGNPYGGDYICGWCEDGVPYADYLRYVESMRLHVFYKNLRAEAFNAFDQVRFVHTLGTGELPRPWVDMIVAVWVGANSRIARWAS